MSNLLEDYESYLTTEKKASANTVSSYLRDVHQFAQEMEERDVPLDEVLPRDVEDYIRGLTRRGKSAATVTRSVASIKSFYNCLLSRGLVESNPARNVTAAKVERKLPQILTGKEVELFLEQPDCSDLKGFRDRAMLELLYATGIRASELINLNIQDLNLRSGVLYCRGSKGVRSIPVYPSAVVAVSDYIYRMRGLITGPESGNALFVNLNGGRLTRQGFWKIVKGYATEAGITKEITPHTLRHSFALHLLENGASVKDIQTMMGHADISSTQVYVQLLDSHVKQVYNDCHPKAKLG